MSAFHFIENKRETRLRGLRRSASTECNIHKSVTEDNLPRGIPKIPPPIERTHIPQAQQFVTESPDMAPALSLKLLSFEGTQNKTPQVRPGACGVLKVRTLGSFCGCPRNSLEENLQAEFNFAARTATAEQSAGK